MKKLGLMLSAAFIASMAMIPAAASADTITYFNDGNGNCGYMSCGSNGCNVIGMENCPNEVSEHG